MSNNELLRLKSVRFRLSDYNMWIATDGVRCVSASTITECVDRAARIMNWGTGEYPREEKAESP